MPAAAYLALENPGTSCYANSVVQALTQLPALLPTLESSRPLSPPAESLLALLADAADPGDGVYSTFGLRNSLRMLAYQMRDAGFYSQQNYSQSLQQDAHEFLLDLLQDSVVLVFVSALAC